ncbi:hypothetical protein LCGC14_1872050 [marine sediment metagenome]|uniref:Uncharacterized protein n=1 Tax=marine sediment metagenome TaxID=412755 RepID=A0A0F9GST6_9ZZZZ
MAFSIRGLDPGASGKGAPNRATYGTTADNAATGEGANYFDSVSGALDNDFNQGEIFCVWSDAAIQYGYTISAGVVTLDTGNKNTLD